MEAELRPRLRVRGDTRRVVVGRAGDQPGAELPCPVAHFVSHFGPRLPCRGRRVYNGPEASKIKKSPARYRGLYQGRSAPYLRVSTPPGRNASQFPATANTTPSPATHVQR